MNDEDVVYDFDIDQYRMLMPDVRERVDRWLVGLGIALGFDGKDSVVQIRFAEVVEDSCAVEVTVFDFEAGPVYDEAGKASMTTIVYDAVLHGPMIPAFRGIEAAWPPCSTCGSPLLGPQQCPHPFHQVRW